MPKLTDEECILSCCRVGKLDAVRADQAAGVRRRFLP
jgi:hypothetical protein